MFTTKRTCLKTQRGLHRVSDHQEALRVLSAKAASILGSKRSRHMSTCSSNLNEVNDPGHSKISRPGKTLLMGSHQTTVEIILWCYATVHCATLTLYLQCDFVVLPTVRLWLCTYSATLYFYLLCDFVFTIYEPALLHYLRPPTPTLLRWLLPARYLLPTILHGSMYIHATYVGWLCDFALCDFVLCAAAKRIARMNSG